jgi:hypothetical protein
MKQNPRLQQDVMQCLQQMLLSHHHYAKVYQHVYEILQGHNPKDNISIYISASADLQPDTQRYNAPTADEVAVILPGTDFCSHGVGYRDIIIWQKGNGQLQRIHNGHCAYAPLHYVLLFPYGTLGWYYDMVMNNPVQPDSKLLQLRYYVYQLFMQPGYFNAVLHAGRLTQQYIVDAWACIEQDCLHYFTLPAAQKQLQAEIYKGLADHVQDSSHDLNLNNVGCQIILPSLFTSGPHYMHQICQDALAIGCYYKKPDLFITMTANPNWIEITQELQPFETVSNRPDLVTRVFHLKKSALLEDIMTHEIFGPVSAHIYTVEFQKHGLPHMHLLIFLKQGHKITTTDDVDAIICAYWPNPVAEPVLFEVVKRCMVHGPCGAANPSAPCMKDGKCSKGYPKPFCLATSIEYEGYLEYLQPDDGWCFQVGSQHVNNTWIVPHNPYLLSWFNCHINVETCISFSTIKYLAKYIHKGPDQATLEVFKGDRVMKYLDTRYISACKATFCMYEFKLHHHSPTVYRLQVSIIVFS